MKASKLNKKTFKLISATAMAIFSLFVSMSGAYAWFMSSRNTETSSDSFYVAKTETSVEKVTIHPFIGRTNDANPTAFAFDPNGVDVYVDGVFDDEAATVELSQYSTEYPDHPALIMFEVSGPHSEIFFKTDYCFLGNDNSDFIAAKTNTKAELNGLSKTNGNYYLVKTDESNSNKTTLYIYNNSTLTSRNIATYSALDVEGNRNNAAYYYIENDEEHGNVATIYQYSSSTEEFTMKWIDLGIIDEDLDPSNDETSPLSSAVNFHYFVFDDSFEDLTVTRLVEEETFNSLYQTYSYSEPTSRSCLVINESEMLGPTEEGSNQRSFTNFTSEEVFDYNNRIIAFNGDTVNKTYIGIVVNYDRYAIEYICSHNLGHQALNEGLVFKCDWITEF